MNNKLLNPKEVSEQLGISPAYVRKLAREGKLRSLLIGSKTVRFTQQEVDRFIKDWQPPKVKVPHFKEED